MENIDRNLVAIYLQMTENLGNESKLELISGLIDSMKKVEEKPDESFLHLYGALDTDESAEELIERIRTSRK